MLKIHDLERILSCHLHKFIKEDRHIEYTIAPNELIVRCLYYGDEVEICVSEGLEGPAYTITCSEYSADFRIVTPNAFHVPYFVALALERLGATETIDSIDFDPLFSYSE